MSEMALVDSATDAGEVLTSLDGDMLLEPVPVDDDPYVQAEARVALLNRSFAQIIVVISKMHTDEDWRYLTRADGSSYQSLSEVVADALGVSLSMARRYIQGARDFYLPLMDFTVDGTVIPITSRDIAILGREGLDEAVETAKSRLGGLDNPAEQSAAISAALNDTRERRSNPADDDPFADDGVSFDAGDGSPSAAAFRGGGRGDDDGLGGDDEWADSGTGDTSPPAAADLSGHTNFDLTDPVARVMDGAQTYLTVEDQSALPDGLREAEAALVTLSQIDPSTLARLVTYDTRGVLEPMDDALANMTRLRALVETLPWFMARLTP